jgi:putative endonuclease
MFFVYVLKSQKDGRYYYGSTFDLDERIKYHNSGKVRSTKYRRPLEIHYFETYETKTEALKRERFFKTGAGHYWLKQNGII